MQQCRKRRCEVVTAPAKFFKTMPKTGGFLEPLIFAVIMGFIAGIIQALINILGLSYAYVGFVESLGMIIFVPIFAVIGSFIGAAIIYVIWKLIGSQENYETSYRCAAYLMALVPYCCNNKHHSLRRHYHLYGYLRLLSGHCQHSGTQYSLRKSMAGIWNHRCCFDVDHNHHAI